MNNLESFNEIDNYFNLEELNIENENNLEINNSEINKELGELKCNIENENLIINDKKENEVKILTN